GFKRIIVFPYFLFSGVLVSRIREHTRRVAADFPDIEFLEAGYLGDHSFVIDTFKDRFDELIEGDNAMNCSLCKYRDPLLGFESEVGLVQESHHHHVEGLMESCKLCESECNGLCQPPAVSSESSVSASHQHDHSHDHQHQHGAAHEHSHGHHPYPHANHPLGPDSLKSPDLGES
ncbi:MAG: CbiX/SirB N-terminal domain-containing protein, partial [Prochlorococcus sp.]